MSRDEMWDKFSDCAGRVLTPEQLPALFDQLDTFRKLPKISAVTNSIETAWTQNAAAAE